MHIPLNIAQIYTNKNKDKNSYFYNIVLTSATDKKFSISTSVLFLNTKDMNLFLSDTYDYKIWSYEAQKNLSGKQLAAFKKLLTSGDFSPFKPVAEQPAPDNNAGQDFDDDIPF